MNSAITYIQADSGSDVKNARRQLPTLATNINQKFCSKK